MSDVFRKLQFKAQDRVCVLDAPPEFEPHLEAISRTTRVSRRGGGRENLPFLLIFVRRRSEIAHRAPMAARWIEPDGLLWLAYPKKSSRRYESDIRRDDSWQSLGDMGFEAVRQIAIDDDWSALRFRRVEQIKTMKRDSRRAMTAQGRRRTR